MEVINEDEVSTEALLQLFRRAFLKAKIDDDGDVYITDGLDFPIWVAVDSDRRLIRFFTFIQSDEGRPFTEAAANHANATVVLRKGSEIWHAGTFDGAIGKQELLAAYLNQIEFGGREIVGLWWTKGLSPRSTRPGS